MDTKPGAATSVPILVQLIDAKPDDKLNALQAQGSRPYTHMQEIT